MATRGEEGARGGWTAGWTPRRMAAKQVPGTCAAPCSTAAQQQGTPRKERRTGRQAGRQAGARWRGSARQRQRGRPLHGGARLRQRRGLLVQQWPAPARRAPRPAVGGRARDPAPARPARPAHRPTAHVGGELPGRAFTCSHRLVAVLLGGAGGRASRRVRGRRSRRRGERRAAWCMWQGGWRRARRLDEQLTANALVHGRPGLALHLQPRLQHVQGADHRGGDCPCTRGVKDMEHSQS